LSSFDEFDDELELILTDSCLGLAEEYALNGKLHKACRLLDEAWGHANMTMFQTALQKNKILVSFEFLKQLSPTLDSYEADTLNIDAIMDPYFYDSAFTKYVTLITTEQFGSIDDFASLFLDSNEYNTLLASHLKIRQAISLEKYSDAKKLLIEMMDGDITLPRLLLYFACCDMEICCKESDDYKGAYEFSNNRLEILEHMLIDD